MATPTAIAAYIGLFVLVGFLFLFVNLLVGRLVRPKLPNEEKLEVYECGEPAIGSSFVQFDLRFYVVALVFLVFDVELAFFFPWGGVFGKATQLAADRAPVLAADLAPGGSTTELSPWAAARFRELGIREIELPQLDDARATALGVAVPGEARNRAAVQDVGRRLALFSLVAMAVFFTVLVIGFAYEWKCGDLDWVRTTTSQPREAMPRSPPTRPLEPSHSVLSA